MANGALEEGSGQDTAWLTFRDVQVEEVAVQDGLDDAGHHGDEVEEALEVEAPDPVDEVQGAVEAQEEQVVRGDGLRLPGLADHEELRQDGHRLQVDGEGPQDLREKRQPHQRLRPASAHSKHSCLTVKPQKGSKVWASEPRTEQLCNLINTET